MDLFILYFVEDNVKPILHRNSKEYIEFKEMIKKKSLTNLKVRFLYLCVSCE